MSLLVPSLLSLASSAPSLLTSWYQWDRADKLSKDLHRPDFEIPASEKAALASAKAQAEMTRLPNQSQIEGRLDRVSADKLSSVERLAESPSAALNAAGSIYGQQMDKENELGIAAADMKLKNQEIYREYLDRMGEWENKKWSWDKAEPYLAKAKAIAALREAAIKNGSSGVSNIFGGLSNMFLADHFDDKHTSWLNQLLGGEDGGNNGSGGGSIGDYKISDNNQSLTGDPEFSTSGSSGLNWTSVKNLLLENK